MGAFVELHLHLDGAITPGIARELADLQGIDLPDARPGELDRALSVDEGCTSLNDFLACFDLPISLLQTREGIRAAVGLVQEGLRSQGVVYAELRLAPQQFTRRGLTQGEAVAAALEGLGLSPLPCNLILCCMRGAGNGAENAETVRLAERLLTRDGGVVALDLAGAEALFPTADYVDMLSRAHARGVPLTVHAGEADGPASVRSALATGCSRIGHGVRAASDPDLLALLAERGVTLEVCPTSNVQTHAVPDEGSHPLRALLDAGVRVAIATDDMAISRTDLPREVGRARRIASLTDGECLALQETAVEAAFTSDETRRGLRALLRREEHAAHADR